MKYIISDETNCICVNSENKFYLSNDINEAYEWDFEKANNVLSALPKSLGADLTKLVVKPSPKCNVTIDKIELTFEIDNFVDEIIAKTKQLEERLSFLNSELSRVDLERVDIEHVAEFSNLNVVDGYKLYKKLHDNAIERRKIKDEIFKISLLLKSSMNLKSANNIKSSFDGLKNRKYSPRVLDDVLGQ